MNEYNPLQIAETPPTEVKPELVSRLESIIRDKIKREKARSKNKQDMYLQGYSLGMIDAYQQVAFELLRI